MTVKEVFKDLAKVWVIEILATWEKFLERC